MILSRWRRFVLADFWFDDLRRLSRLHLDRGGHGYIAVGEQSVKVPWRKSSRSICTDVERCGGGPLRDASP